MKVWRELPGFRRKSGLMEKSWNSEGDILTNPETRGIYEAKAGYCQG